MWAWQAEHCPSCHQRRADWLDENGEELRDPPFEIGDDFCPACEVLHDWRKEEGEADIGGDAKPKRRPGTRPYFRHYDDERPEADEAT